MKALLYLDCRKLVNYARAAVRSPKKLIPVLLVVLWLVQAFYFQSIRGRPFRAAYPALSGYSSYEIWAVVFLALSLAYVYLLVRSFSESLLVFSLSDLDFLFATSISKRMVMTFRLLKLYGAVGLFLAIYAVILAPTMGALARNVQFHLFPVGIAALLAFSVFLINIYTTLNLITVFRQEGRWWFARAVKAVAYGLLIFGVVNLGLAYRLTGDVVESARTTLMNPVLLTFLFPAKWTSDLVLAPITGWQRGLGLEFLLLGLCAAASMALLLSRKENPYEPSLAISARRAAARAAFRAGGFGALKAEMWKHRENPTEVKWAMPPFGSGPWSIVWKNANVGLRTWFRGYVIGLAVVVVAVTAYRIVVGPYIDADLLQTGGIVAILYLLWGVSMVVQHAIRADVSHADILKPMPIEAWKLISASAIQGPVTIVLLVWPATALVALLFGLPANSPLIALVLALPFIAYMVSCAQSASAALYPNWNDQTEQIIGFTISSVVTCFSLVPVITVGVLLWLLHAGVVLTALAVSVVSLMMSAACIALGAHAYRRHDPTSD